MLLFITKLKKKNCDEKQHVLKVPNDPTKPHVNCRYKRVLKNRTQGYPDVKRVRMDTSTPVQSHRAQPPIIDEDASLSPVTLSDQDISGGTSVEQDINPTKVSGEIKVLEITPAN